MVAWGANWLDPDRLAVRLLLVGLMFASLLMSAAIPEAFDGRAWLFVTGYLLIQVGRSLFLIIALRGRALGEHFVNDLVWEVLVGGLWIAGALSDGDARLALWGAAVVATHAGTSALHWLPGRGRAIDLAHTEIAGGHLVERFRLFFIIALGETVLTMGTAFTGEPVEAERLLALAIGFTGTVALWWCYFQRAERIGVELAERADDAGAIGWWGTWTVTLMVLALIGVAVGDELAIAHPGDDATLGFTLLTFGGPALFLLAQIIFLHEALGHVPRSRPVGVVALAILAVATAPLSLIVGIAAATAVLVAVAVADERSADEPAPAGPIERLAHPQRRRGVVRRQVRRHRLEVAPEAIAVRRRDAGLVDGDAHRAQPGVPMRSRDPKRACGVPPAAPGRAAACSPPGLPNAR